MSGSIRFASVVAASFRAIRASSAAAASRAARVRADALELGPLGLLPDHERVDGLSFASTKSVTPTFTRSPDS